MSTPSLIDNYDAWEAQRAAVTRAEEDGVADPDEWQFSDDSAVRLLRQAMDVIFGVRDAFDAINEALSDIQTVYEVGFSCGEAEQLYGAMKAVGATETAEWLMACHSTLDDDEGDMHDPILDAQGNLEGWTHRNHDNEEEDDG